MAVFIVKNEIIESTQNTKSKNGRNEIIYESRFILRLNIDILNNYYFNDNYIPILVAIDLGYNTFKEIYDFYPSEVAMEKIKTNFFVYYNNPEETIKEYHEQNKKSEITIKRYISQLKEFGLIIEIGQRLSEKFNFHQKLYGLSAIIFVPIDRDEQIFQNKDSEKVFSILQNLIKKQMNNSTDFEEKIETIFKNLFFSKNELLDIHLTKFISETKPQTNFNEHIRDIKTLGQIGYISFFHYIGLFLNILFDENWINEIISLQTNKNVENLQSTIFYELINNNFSDLNDIIDKREPDIVKFIKYSNWSSYFQKEKYRAIFRILKVQPLTINEIMNKLNKEKSKDKIKRNSLYKKIIELKEAGFIIEAGKIIEKEKNYSSTLYSRSAYIFFLDYSITDPMWANFTRSIGKVIGHSLGKNFTKEKEDKFHIFFMDFFRAYLYNPIEILKKFADKNLIERIINLDERFLFLFIRFLCILEIFLLQEHPLKIKQDLIEIFN
jgi:hypothetical protein